MCERTVAKHVRGVCTLFILSDATSTDDLLGCQCTETPAGKARDIAEGEQSSEHLPDNASGESDSDSNDYPTFISANKYDPEPVSPLELLIILNQNHSLLFSLN